MDRNTPNYTVEEKSNCETLSTTTLKRAFSFEEKANKLGKILVAECIREGKNRRTNKGEY